MRSIASSVLFVLFQVVLVTKLIHAASDVPPTLVVRTYEVTPVPAARWDAAIAEAGALLRAAGIRVEWVPCSTVRAGEPESGPAHCTMPFQPNEVVLRAVSRPTLGPRDRILLGDAMVDASKGSGTLATIYMNHIEQLARDAGVSIEIVMARAMAHELGHLLLGTNAHSASGLMRPTWRPEEFAPGPPANWLIPPADSARMREAFANRLG